MFKRSLICTYFTCIEMYFLYNRIFGINGNRFLKHLEINDSLFEVGRIPSTYHILLIYSWKNLQSYLNRKIWFLPPIANSSLFCYFLNSKKVGVSNTVDSAKCIITSWTEVSIFDIPNNHPSKIRMLKTFLSWRKDFKVQTENITALITFISDGYCRYLTGW